MQVVFFNEIGDAAWHNALSASDDAWFWHTRLYSNFLFEINKARGVRDISFALLDKSRIVAVCPLYLDDVDGTPQLGCGDEPVPFPALAKSLHPSVREAVLEYYFNAIARFAKLHHVAYIRLRVSPLCRNHVANSIHSLNPLLRYGLLDIPIATQVIDLQQDEESLWTGVRKGHRYDIRRSEKVCKTTFWNSETITVEVFSRYQQLHEKDAGRITRSQRSFDVMIEWIEAGHAVLAEATHYGSSVAFALIILFNDGAFYGSACKDPEVLDLNASHMLQWHTIRWLKASGYKHYDMGLQYFSSQWSFVPSEKELSISKYKRGFGGTTISVHSGEHFFLETSLKNTLEKRIHDLSSSFKLQSKSFSNTV